jgi:hypothetical protein
MPMRIIDQDLWRLKKRYFCTFFVCLLARSSQEPLFSAEEELLTFGWQKMRELFSAAAPAFEPFTFPQ